MSIEHTAPVPKADEQEIILIRHGQSTANATGVWQGQLDYSLSKEGRRQAAAAGRALRGANICGIYASPLSRALETAEIVARETGFSGQVVALPDLTERGGGILEGLTWEEQEARNPEFVRKFLALPEEERWTVAGAETDEEILGRFERALSEIRAHHRENEGPLIIVSHGGIMRAFLRDLYGPEVLPGHERAPNCSFTRLLWNLSEPQASPELLELASTKHLSL